MREAVDSLRSLALARADGAKSDPFLGASAPPAALYSSPPAQGTPSGTAIPNGEQAVWSIAPPATHASGMHAQLGTTALRAAPTTSGTVDLPDVRPAGGGRAAGVVIASVVLVLSVLAASGYMFLARGQSRAAAALAVPDAAVGSGASAAGLPSASASAPAPSAVAATATCPQGMALVPGGRFFMGSDDDLAAERPAHKVTLRAYCMDKLETTTDAYRACSDRGDCKRAGVTNKWPDITAKDSRIYDPLCNAGATDASRGGHPINCVDWTMADRFCRAEGKRLPTEAEWEFAARGSDGRKYPWGDAAPSVKHLNACGAECTLWGNKHGAALGALFTESDAWATTAPVGSFPLGASRWGIEDLVGNVWEWVADYYAPYGDADQEDPAGPTTGAARGIRGGAWNGAYADWVRPSFRYQSAESTRSHGIGFRCAKPL